jgi:hypothetical protein
MSESKGKSTRSRQADAAEPTASAELIELVFTYDTSTGQFIKAERIDASGARQELTDEEYQLLGGYDPATYPTYLDYVSQPFDAYTSPQPAGSYDPYGYEEGYWRAMADYAAAASGAGVGYYPQAGGSPQTVRFSQASAPYLYRYGWG